MAEKKSHQLVLILDFGGQYNQLIARRIRSEGVYCELVPFDVSVAEIKKKKPVGLVLTGGPSVVTQAGAPMMEREILDLGIPILGICYGCQLLGYLLGGEVVKAKKREYGATELRLTEEGKKSALLQNLAAKNQCWMSHTYYVARAPVNFEILATSETCPTAAIGNREQKIYGVQFHPEVTHTKQGQVIIHNFLYNICGCTGDWQMATVAKELIRDLRAQIGPQKVVVGMSGGVDSTVTAALLSEAIGKQLTCVLVDHGFMRQNEISEVVAVFERNFEAHLEVADASEQFLRAIKGVVDPEKKRKIIGREFIKVFEKAAQKIGRVDLLAQGTIYPDVVESGTEVSATIKSHHNVGGLPEVMDFKGVIEPLRLLFKDEVRALGQELGLPEEIVWRQPFPGPGLAIRVMGEIDEEKLTLLRGADAIFREEIFKAGWHQKISQYFAVLTDTKAVGVMGDERTYDRVIALRAVETDDFMTATWAHLPFAILEKISSRIVNEVAGINRVVYDVTTKPPATIEWE